MEVKIVEDIPKKNILPKIYTAESIGEALRNSELKEADLDKIMSEVLSQERSV